MSLGKRRLKGELLGKVVNIDETASMIGKVISKSFSIREIVSPVSGDTFRGISFYKLGIHIQTIEDMTGGKTTYNLKTGGFFTTKLSFIRIYDSSTGKTRRIIKKYKPGNWESAVEVADRMIEKIYDHTLGLQKVEMERRLKEEERVKRGHAGILEKHVGEATERQLEVNAIHKYDENLERDITQLETYIAKDEEEAKQQMELDGCPKETIEEIIKKRRDEGRHMRPPYFPDMSTGESDDLLKELRELCQAVNDFPFRLYLNLHLWFPDPLSVQVVTNNGEFWLNTTILTDNERRKLVAQIFKLLKLNMGCVHYGMQYFYPSVELMRFIAEMLPKHESEDLLSKTKMEDRVARDLLREMLRKKNNLSNKDYRGEL